MHFTLQKRWHCQFLEEDLKTPLARSFNFKTLAKVVDTAERGGYSMHLEWRQALECAIERRRGGASGWS
jgi:hypothetical protein